jgi:hypothetical protein
MYAAHLPQYTFRVRSMHDKDTVSSMRWGTWGNTSPASLRSAADCMSGTCTYCAPTYRCATASYATSYEACVCVRVCVCVADICHGKGSTAAASTTAASLGGECTRCDVVGIVSCLLPALNDHSHFVVSVQCNLVPLERRHRARSRQ